MENKDVTLLFDFNNLAIRVLFSKEVEANSSSPQYALWKYMILNILLRSFYDFENVKKIVLAVDSKKSWRKLYFPRYKEDRDSKREKSDVDWNTFFGIFNDYLKQIKKYLPFVVIQIRHAEADDIIGVLTSQNDHQQKIIVSADEDYTQCISESTKVYHPLRKEYVECEDVEMFIVEKCLTGQAKDCIFNILTPLDYPKDKRKPGFGKKSFEKIKNDYRVWLKEMDLEKRFEVNRNLIDFNRIPQTIRKGIMSEYEGYVLPDPNKMFEFFKMNGFKGFIEEYHNIENLLLRLY